MSATGLVTGVTRGPAEITATYTPATGGGTPVTGKVTVTVENPLTIRTSSTSTATSATLNAYGDYVTLTAYFGGTALPAGSTVTWAASGNSAGYVSLSANSGLSINVSALANTPSGGVTITATYGTYTATFTVNVNFSAQINTSVTVYDSNSGYALTDTPDEGNTGSIADQIDAQVRRQYVSSYNYYYTVEFDQTGNASSRNGYLSASNRYSYYAEDLDEVVFEPTANLTSASSTAEASYGFTVRVYRSNSNTPEKTLTGLMTFKIKQGTSGGDISYVAGLGEDVYFNVADFEDFWNGSSRNTLDYVTFSAPSGGTLYNSSSRNTSSTPCYVDPTSRQTGLDGVYFSPNSTTSKKATTIRISFTAHGRNSGSKNGVVVISYLNKSASDITYSTNANGTVSLKASDFTAAYKEATGSTAPSNMTIVFQGVPTYGSLTYLDSSKRNAKEVKLTNANIKSRSFTAKTSGTNQLEDVTYTGSGTRSDTIEYIAYSGSTAQFSGKVVFNTVTAPTDVRVVLPTCTLSTGVALPPSYFTNANTAMSNASYVIFSGSPRLGRLSYANGSVTTAIPVNMLASVTYIPTGTNGTDSFNFTAYNSSNTVVASGTVSVVVSLSTTTPGGVSNINQFTDVTPTAYYRTYLSDLISRGVIKGTGSGKFDPEGTLDYSQALKFILNAAGYVVPELEGANWALNYKTLAVQNGWLSSTVVLTNPISREAMAELAAKALGIGSSSAASPFSDTTNPYAVALYNTTPKIIRGQDSSAKPAFKPNDTLKRHEMVSLVYNMYQYKAANP